MNRLFGYDSKNWMFEYCKYDREHQIINALKKAHASIVYNLFMCRQLMDQYIFYKGFLKEGVIFKYFYSLFVNDGIRKMGDLLENIFKFEEIDLVMPMESRGLFL